MNSADAGETPAQDVAGEEVPEEPVEGEVEGYIDVPDDVREALLVQVVGYDDICRLWFREKSVRLRVLGGLLEYVCNVLKIAEGPDSAFDKAKVTAEVATACYDMIAAIRDEIQELTCQPWPKRPLLVEESQP